MFIGHFAVGLALKRVSPRTSLGVLTAAAQWPDLLWPVLLLVGWERVRIDPGNTAVTPLAFDSYPISHSLFMVAVWGMAAGGLYFSRTNRRAAAVWVGVAVVSHWVFDWVTHGPDMPLMPGSSVKVGLGLWRSIPATVIVEGAMLVVAVWAYTRATRPRDRQGSINLWIYLVVLASIYAVNLAGPPPPTWQAVATVALGLWLFPLWAAWIDRHRLATQ